MSDAFDRAFAFTQQPSIEGTIADNPLDRGGLTNCGFTQGLYNAWRGSKKLPQQSVTLITDAEKVAIAREEFWVPCKCDLLPDTLAMAVFDTAFNSNPWHAKTLLQRAVHVKVDGDLGPITLAAVHSTPDVALRFLERRMAYIQEIIIERPSQVAFLEGWGVRLLRLAWKGEGNAIGIQDQAGT